MTRLYPWASLRYAIRQVFSDMRRLTIPPRPHVHGGDLVGAESFGKPAGLPVAPRRRVGKRRGTNPCLVASGR